MAIVGPFEFDRADFPKYASETNLLVSKALLAERLKKLKIRSKVIPQNAHLQGMCVGNMGEILPMGFRDML